VCSSDLIASSGGPCSLNEVYNLKPTADQGYYGADNRLVCYALTPGYETYRGLGWYGCIESSLADERSR
jgi:hypothetical protein